MRTRTGIVLGLLLVLPVAACGRANPSEEVASANGAASQNPSPTASANGLTEQAQALKFAQCMRDNGIADFPDPDVSDDGGMRISVPEGTSPQQAEAATKLCAQYLPNGGQPAKPDAATLEKLRKFSQCMRDHGLPDFPDPSADGGILIQRDDTNGSPALSPDDPTFQAAQSACSQYSPGPTGQGSATANNGGSGGTTTGHVG
jgi:hypothetical protein